MSYSWLWGGKQPQIPENFADFIPPTGGSGGGGGSGDDDKPKTGKSGAMEAYRFDSSALEKAAESARTLEKNRKLPFAGK